MESFFSKSNLISLLEIIKQEPDMIKWPVERVLKTIMTMEPSIKKSQIGKKFIKKLNKLKEIQEVREFKKFFIKIFNKYKDIYDFFLKDSSSLIIQFFRIISFLDFIVSMVEQFDLYKSVMCEKYGGEGYYLDKEERQEQDELEEEEFIISLHFIEDRIEVNSKAGEKRTKFPLSLDKSIPSSLKQKYYRKKMN